MQDGRSRKPFLWARKEDEFNLTELIDSVERKIWLLEEMENRPIAANSLLSLKSESETTEEDLLLTLPGYRPKKKVATAATRMDPNGNYSDYNSVCLSPRGCVAKITQPIRVKFALLCMPIIGLHCGILPALISGPLSAPSSPSPRRPPALPPKQRNRVKQRQKLDSVGSDGSERSAATASGRLQGRASVHPTGFLGAFRILPGN